MSKAQEIVESIFQKKFNAAKELIHELMNEKIGIILEETLVNYAPTILEGKKSACACGEKNCDCDKVKKSACACGEKNCDCYKVKK